MAIILNLAISHIGYCLYGSITLAICQFNMADLAPCQVPTPNLAPCQVDHPSIGTVPSFFGSVPSPPY
ncbi:hypothetical protein KM472_gp178 [Cynomolgus macaque cytomegalovirus strain Ottawa]|uniref:Uncharacterized protein n=1 Tax=macacine betaherpesvirus 8 TaxID=2560567 RepID=G8H0Q7_9BETA|nr:hypothetical protein KM472_gp178 [Cynomolgus macaque cytomegalovirus strain Ottawa]AEQ32255.1 hypothetical protein cy167 [Cynomolgus macaque cytomegalovirus strain Ottawa]